MLAKQQGGTVSVYLPQVSWSLSRQADLSPLDIAKTYTGKINSVPWNVDPSSSAFQWLCTSIIGNSDNDGQTYFVTYSFQFNDDPYWRGTVVYIDPETGRRHKDATDAAGAAPRSINYPEVYNDIDFNDLGLA